MELSFTPSRAVRPDEETLTSAREVCALLLRQPDEFARAFRVNLPAVTFGVPSPDAATVEAALHLAESVVSAIVMERDADAIESSWATAGGVRAAVLPSDELVAAAVKALVRSVRDVCADDWSSSMGSQWAGMQLWLTPYLLAGAAHARATGHAVPAPAPPLPEPEPGALWAADPGWPDDAGPGAARGGQDGASRHDRKRRGAVRRGTSSDEWLP